VFRSFLERLSRGKSFCRRLPAEFGRRPLHVSPDSALSYLKPDWARSFSDLLSAALKYVAPSDTVWDIGANVGVFSLAAAHVAGPDASVLAVEADPFLAALLQKTVCEGINADLRISVLCAAASEESGIASFLIAERGRSFNSLERSGHRQHAGGSRYRQYVPTITLDSLLDQFVKPDVMKVDVEGAEALVLKGASHVLSQCRPLVYIEVGAEQNAAVMAEFKRHAYRLYDADSEDEREREGCSFNTLAVPIESQRTNRRP
jgi:FkbM family methyltransferase